MRAAKFVVGLVGAVVTTLLQLLGPEGTTGKVLTIVAALVTAIGVYVWPNTPDPAAVAGQARPLRR